MSSAAPWNTDPSNLDMRLRALDRRLMRVEAVMAQDRPQGADQPREPSFPPVGAIPRALTRLFNVRQQVHQVDHQFRMMYDFLLQKFPNAVQELERCLRNRALSPAPSDDLPGADDATSAASLVPPTGVDRPQADSDGDEYDEYGDEIIDDAEPTDPAGEPHEPRELGSFPVVYQRDTFARIFKLEPQNVHLGYRNIRCLIDIVYRLIMIDIDIVYI